MKATRSTGHHKTRRDRHWSAYEHDPYKAAAKLPEGTWCRDCGAIVADGRWCWNGTKDEAKKHLCPACQRIDDELPAGYVSLSGAFLIARRDEILRAVRNVEQREKAEHPMQRIMKIDQEGAEMLVTTTDVHLARAIGEALRHAYQGELEAVHSVDQDLVRVRWSRD
jgi:soluble cytochrome b562